MRATIGSFAAAAAVIGTATASANAQQAVQWRVEDGGNGHWYWFDSTSRDWAAARSMAEARGGHLATIASPSENQFVLQTLASHAFYADYWLGGYRIDDSCTPPCVRWITGEPWSFEVWDGGDSWGCWDPNPNACGWNGPGTGLALEFNNRPDTIGYGKWNDESPNLYFNGNIIGNPSILEWSADCNNDGIVDYGQCRDGSLPDYNLNNIPDCCEAGTPCEVGNYPVQWRVEDGGNGHWYRTVTVEPRVDHAGAIAFAASRGAHLFTGCGAEFDAAISLTQALSPTFWIAEVSSQWTGPWIGLRLHGSSWSWVDTSTCTFDRWDASMGQPDSPASPGESVAHLYTVGSGPAAAVHDVPADRTSGSMILEWSADCNGDGIVDYGQILQGQLIDANNNGIPDSCEVDPCPGDVTGNGSVNGLDLAAVLGAWGTNGQGEFNADIDNDGIVSGTDLAFVLGGWGPCP